MPGMGSPGGGVGVPNVPSSMPTVRNLQSGGGPVFEYPFAISGVTKDSTGAALGNCSVVALRTADNSIAALGSSDGSGNYRLGASSEIAHYVVAYKAGVPDVAGVTVNTIVGS